MTFTSPAFAVFLVLVYVVFRMANPALRWLVVLAASLGFYMTWQWGYIFLMLVSSAICYATGRAVDRSPRGGLLIGVCIGANLGILAFFKYANFVLDSFAAVGPVFDTTCMPRHLAILLPAGISFYTLQMIGYVIDVHKRRVAVETNYLRFLLFTSFFPHVLAGPIARAGHLLPQLRAKFQYNADDVRCGLMLMAWGFFKKLVIADRISIVVDRVYASPGQYSAIPLTLATIFFAYQLYCDFSGYCDIGMGVARLFGVRLSGNFCRPFFAANIRDFWSRWHVSLTSWFRDYVYIPLGGNRRGGWRQFLNVMVVFLASGLWHGAAWTFVCWGLLHCVYYCCHRVFVRYAAGCTLGLVLPKLVGRVLATGITWTAVTLAWVFFRANTIGDAGTIIGRMFSAWTFDLDGVDLANIGGIEGIAFCLVLIGFLEGMQLLQEIGVDLRSRLTSRSWVYCASMAAAVAAVVLLGIFADRTFIYFQF